MTRLGRSLALAALLTVGVNGHVQAQSPQCNDRDVVLDLLSQKYKEHPVAVGVANNGGLVEVLTSADGETWSIIITSPKGMSCLVAAGEGWRMFKDPIPDGPEA